MSNNHNFHPSSNDFSSNDSNKNHLNLTLNNQNDLSAQGSPQKSLVQSPFYNNPFETESSSFQQQKSINNSDMEDYTDRGSFDFEGNAFGDENAASFHSTHKQYQQQSHSQSQQPTPNHLNSHTSASPFDQKIPIDRNQISQISRFATPDTQNSFLNVEPPRRKHSNRQHHNQLSGLDSLNENESTVSFSKPPIDYTLSEVGTVKTDDADDGDVSLHRNGTIMKRNRWGTQRHKSGRPKKPARAKTLKFKSNEHGNGIISRKNTFRKSSANTRKSSLISDHHHDDENPEQTEAEKDDKNRSNEHRSIFFNLPLPPDMVDEEQQPIAQYARNKIRTTKYTPLTFIPKNLYIQFGNVANIYFLVLIVLGFFSIFGVPNPGLAMVPLIVIVAITAIKDAIEDSRRTGLDMELNNTITHILTGIPNPNVSADNVSLWRKFKKLNSKLLFSFIGFLKSNLSQEARRAKQLEKLRQSKKIDDTFSDSQDQRKSFESFETQAYNKSKNIPMEDLKSIRTSETTINDENNPNNPFKGPSLVDRRAPVSHNSSFQKRYWKEVQVGDIVRIHNNDELPADIVILSTSDSDGACYVETKNLDGETNLKVRQSLKCSTDLKHSVDCERAKFWVESEGPHANLYSYQGVCKYRNEDNEIISDPITINNMLLRGCFLRNTKWVIGMVVFTGDDTKIMLNAGITPTKISRMSRELNFSVIMNFALLFILCFVAGLVNGIYYNRSGTSRDYYEFGTVANTPVLNGIVTFFVAVILYQSLVPISLYISIEIIKTAQAFFIYSDVQMYYERLDFPCTPKSWNISDDLGQIEYIFSDKTGTLTQNVMEFKKTTINGISYGKAYTEALAGLRKRQGIDVEQEGEIERAAIENDKKAMMNELYQASKNSQLVEDNVTFISSEFVKDLRGAKGPEQKKANEHFMLCLALCHSVLAEPNKSNPDLVVLKAQSPDESALVGTATDMGFAFVGRTKKGVIIEVQGVRKEFQVLNTLEFNSTRKRMSAIVKLPPRNPGEQPRALLICKGADSIIYSRLRTDSDQTLLEKTALHLEGYATEGLRTLCIAQKEIPWEEYQVWSKRHEEASAAIEGREEKMEEVAESIERDLTLIGGTAIEDRLQEGVSDSIAILGKAGIKLWVLTGDKVETAINIGFSCNLLNSDMDLLVIKTAGEDAENLSGEKLPKKIVASLIDRYLKEKFDLEGTYDDLEYAKNDHSPPRGNFGLVIDGDALKIALSPEFQMKFLLLCKSCKAVLCCRVSPAQKASVVSMVKDSLDVMTLAIGDGSNDVAMIQAANVGVGIAGEEGRQAVMSSDYAIGQFRYLTRLLLVHGRWSYKRLAEMIPCFFYKNVIFTLALFWYGIHSDFDGAYLFEYTYLMFYNLAFTSLPIIFLGIFDQDVNSVVSLLVPQLYRSGILRSEWSNTKFWWYMIDALYQSVISYFFPYLVFYRNGFVDSSGLTVQHRYWMGMYVATIAAVACDLYVLMHQYRWDWISLLFCSLSILVVFGWTGVWSSATYSAEFYKSAFQVYGSVSFWACIFVGILCCLLPRFSYDSWKRVTDPKDIDIVRECVDRGDFSQYPEDYDPTDVNKKKISKYSREATTENQISYQEDDFGNGNVVAYDNKSAEDMYVPAAMVRTQEIPMEYVDSGNGHKRLSERFSSEQRNRSSFQSTHSRYRTSLDATRAQMLENNELMPTMSFGGRTSLDIPGVSTANRLITRTRSNNAE